MLIRVQAAALSMEEKDKIANEEAERRLKATLAAKREPSMVTSRVASPNQGEPATPVEATPRPKTPASEAQVAADPVPMEGVEVAAPVSPPNSDVRFFFSTSWIFLVISCSHDY